MGRSGFSVVSTHESVSLLFTAYCIFHMINCEPAPAPPCPVGWWEFREFGAVLIAHTCVTCQALRCMLKLDLFHLIW